MLHLYIVIFIYEKLIVLSVTLFQVSSQNVAADKMKIICVLLKSVHVARTASEVLICIGLNTNRLEELKDSESASDDSEESQDTASWRTECKDS